jgi:hypothetical protein
MKRSTGILIKEPKISASNLILQQNEALSVGPIDLLRNACFSSEASERYRSSGLCPTLTGSPSGAHLSDSSGICPKSAPDIMLRLSILYLIVAQTTAQTCNSETNSVYSYSCPYKGEFLAS